MDMEVEWVIGNAEGPYACCAVIGDSHTGQQQNQDNERYPWVSSHRYYRVVESLEDRSEDGFHEQG
jgi:hypothetical protein